MQLRTLHGALLTGSLLLSACAAELGVDDDDQAAEGLDDIEAGGTCRPDGSTAHPRIAGAWFELVSARDWNGNSLDVGGFDYRWISFGTWVNNTDSIAE